ncbi:MAG: LacI family DNA-binding transcriptional regulator [Anaerolineales bacterium]|nr:LacI family DNA-binding transcriptional regulator [Anaerolineales bacterium]
MTVRISDVARRANVSVATVSRVLTKKTPVSEELSERVMQAVKELGYQPSRVAQSLRKKTSSILGLIISDIQNPFFTSLVRAVEDAAYQYNYGIFLCNSDEDIEKESFYIDLLIAEQVSGVVISPSQERNNPSKKLLDAGIPVVSVDRRMLDLEVDTVVIDNVESSRALVNHLIEDGHRQIGAILGSDNITTGRERRLGYSAALKDHGILPVEEYVLTGQPKKEFGFDCTNRLIDLENPPTAIFAGNNLIAMGALMAIQSRGMVIPDEIALVAFDDLDWTALVRPAITVVKQPTYRLGASATDLLLRRIEDEDRPIAEVVLKPPLCIRQSCAHHAAGAGKFS